MTLICGLRPMNTGGGVRGQYWRNRAIDYVFRIIDIPAVYYIVALVIAVIIWKVWRWEAGLLVAYVFLIIAETLLIRRPFEGQHFQPQIFWSWRVWEEQRRQIISNVVMFVPIGVLTGRFWRWRALVCALGLSVVIEVAQFITSRGLCEFDDVAHNCLGAAIGILIVLLLRCTYSQRRRMNRGENPSDRDL